MHRTRFAHSWWRFALVSCVTSLPLSLPLPLPQKKDAILAILTHLMVMYFKEN
jgi:hypothetical protein